MIWERIPKIHYVGLDKLELGVYDAIDSFNYGKQACLDILENMSIFQVFGNGLGHILGNFYPIATKLSQVVN